MGAPTTSAASTTLSQKAGAPAASAESAKVKDKSPNPVNLIQLHPKYDEEYQQELDDTFYFSLDTLGKDLGSYLGASDMPPELEVPQLQVDPDFLNGRPG